MNKIKVILSRDSEVIGTTELELVKIGWNCLYFKNNEFLESKRLFYGMYFKIDDKNIISIPINKRYYKDGAKREGWSCSIDGRYIFGWDVRNTYASVDFSEIENIINENNWRIGEYDFSPVIIDEEFTDENMTVKEAYYKSKVIDRYINRTEGDLDGMKAADMTLKEAKQYLNADEDTYIDVFYGTDSVCRWMVTFMLYDIVR